MKPTLILFSFLLFFSSNTSDEKICDIKYDDIEIGGILPDSYYAKVFYNPRPWEVGGNSRSLLHEFDCSIPRWRKGKAMTSCQISANIELILYESENYKGDYKVLDGNSSSLKNFPKKFLTPGSIEVFYKGNRSCISKANSSSRRKSNNRTSSNRNSTSNSPSNNRRNNSSSSKNTERNASSYVSVKTEMAKPFSNLDYYIYIYNYHTSKTISVRYSVKDKYGEQKHNIKIYPNERESVGGYNLPHSQSVSILSARYVDD